MRMPQCTTNCYGKLFRWILSIYTVLYTSIYAKIKFVLFERTLEILKNINLQLFHILLSSWDIYTYVIFKWDGLWRYILTYWKIVYIFKIIEWNHLKLCMCIQTRGVHTRPEPDPNPTRPDPKVGFVLVNVWLYRVGSGSGSDI